MKIGLPCKLRKPVAKMERLGGYLTISRALIKVHQKELLLNLVFENYRSCGDLVLVCGFNSVFEADASDDFGEAIKSA